MNTHGAGPALGGLRRDGRRGAQRSAASLLQREREADEDETRPAVRRRRTGRWRRHVSLDQRDRRGTRAELDRRWSSARRRSNASACGPRRSPGTTCNGRTFMVAGYEGHEFLLVRLLIEAGANVPYSLDRRQLQSAGARGGSAPARAGLHRALRRELRRRDRRAVRSRVRLRDRDDPAVRARQRARHPVDLLHERDRDALDDARRRAPTTCWRWSTQTLGAKPRYERIARFFAEDDAAPRTHLHLVGAQDRSSPST